MTLREKLELDHPECIDENVNGGCKDCPSMYGYPAEDLCDCKTCNDELCRKCWDRKYEGELTPQEKKIEELMVQDRVTRQCIVDNIAETINLRRKLHRIIDHVSDKTESFWNPYINKDSYIIDEFDKMMCKRDWWKTTCIMSWIGFIITSIIIGFGG